MASKGYRARIKLAVDTSALRALRRNAPQVLRELEGPVLTTAKQIAANAATSVPRGGAPTDPLDLADTAFVSLPHHNLSKRLSVTVTTGYDHPQAGPVHEGFHFGEQTKVPPPHWLRNAAKRGGGRSLLRRLVKAQLKKSLAKLFPQK